MATQHLTPQFPFKPILLKSGIFADAVEAVTKENTPDSYRFVVMAGSKLINSGSGGFSRHALCLMLTTAFTPAVMSAQAPGPNIGQIGAIDLQRRFPSTLSPALAAQIKAPPASWQIDPSLLTLVPQAVANAVAADIKQRMAGKSVGFSVTVMMPGGASASANGGMARSLPDTAARAWTADDRISIASVSKTVTAAAMLQAIAAKSVGLDTPSWTLLPADWTYAPSFETITLRQMMSHNSGIRACNIDYEALKSCAAAGVKEEDKNPSIPLSIKYSNANYAFQRIILSRISDGKFPPVPAMGARYWALVNQLVWSKIATGADCSDLSIPNPALSYLSTKDNMVWNSTAPQNFDFATVKPGNDWGDMTSVCGSQGWTVSSRQLATFANALLVTNKFGLPTTTLVMMRAQGLGLMYFDFGGGLTAHGHGGYHPGPQNGGELNTLILSFNNGVSIGAVINSRYRGDIGQDIAEAVRANAK